MNELRKAMQTRWNERGHQYEHVGAHGTKSPVERERWRSILEQLGSGSLDVLDIGTGTGFVALMLAELGYHVTGIDWSTTMLNKAKAKAREAGLEISFLEGETEALPFSSACFDAVVARHVLWTLTEPDQALAEWFRVLKSGGRVFADFSPRRHGEAGHHYPLEIEEKLPLNKDIQPEEMAMLFTNAGFVDVEIQSLSHDPEKDQITYLVGGFRPRGCKLGTA